MSVEIIKSGRCPGSCPECQSLNIKTLPDRFVCLRCGCEWRETLEPINNQVDLKGIQDEN